MDRKNRPPEQPRRNNERQGSVPYHQLAEDMAQSLADLQVPGGNDEGVTSEDGPNENETESLPGPHVPPQERDRRQIRTPYQQLAADMAEPLAELQVPGGNNEAVTSEDGRTDERENSLDAQELPQERGGRQKRTPYQQLAADMAEPLADLQVPVVNNEAVTSEDGRTDERENSLEAQELPQERGGRPKRTPYQQLAAEMAEPLADLQVPGENNEAVTSEDGRTDQRKSRLEAQEQQQERDERERRTPYQQLAAEMVQPLAELRVSQTNNEDKTTSSDVQTKSEIENRRDVASVDQQEATTRKRGRNHYFDLAADMAGALAETRAPAISDERGSQEMQTRRQATESIAHQESLSEYNPDATCGSCYEIYGQSSLQPQSSSETETEACQDEKTESVAQQESLSEYDENAGCGSGFYRTESNMSDYSSVHTAELESTKLGSFETDGFRSKSPSEIDTSQEECYSQVDGEPYSKRTKPNPEVTEERSLPVLGRPCMESTTVGDVEFAPKQESIPEVCSGESKQNDYFPEQNERFGTQNSEGHSRSRNIVSPFEPCLSSEFEHMHLADNSSVETGASFDDSAELSSPVSQSHQEKSPKKDEDYSVVEKHTDSSVVRNDTASCPENADNANISTASTLSQGARPKTSANVLGAKKHKKPKGNTKNAYTELAKHVKEDLSAVNKQLDNSQASTRREAEERKNVRAQELFDGSTVQTATSDVPSQHAPPLKGEQHDAPQQPSLIHDEGHRRRNVREQRQDFSRDATDARATSRQTRGAEAAAEHRSQVEEQQRLIDNMAPELQSMVIEMMQREEEEQRGHVLMQWNPPVPPRVISQERNANHRACAEGASKQSGGKKSRKSQKNKGHYIELAGIMAPQLAAVNKAMVNGHAEGQQETTRHGRTEENHNRFAHGAVEDSSDQEQETVPPRDHQLSNRDTGISSRAQPHAHMSLPHSATSRREPTDGRGAFSLGENIRTSSQRRVNGNRSHGANADSAKKENGGKMGKQKKPKKEENKKSDVLQMAESMAESLQSLNARFDEQQRQQRSVNANGASARPQLPRNETRVDSAPDESVTRDASSIRTNKSNSSRTEKR